MRNHHMGTTFWPPWQHLVLCIGTVSGLYRDRIGTVSGPYREFGTPYHAPLLQQFQLRANTVLALGETIEEVSAGSQYELGLYRMGSG